MNHRRWSWLLNLAVSAGLVAYILWWVPWHDMTDSLRTARSGPVLLGLAASAVVVWLYAVQMKILFDATGYRMSTSVVLAVNLTTEFYAFFLPGYAFAGALRWYRFTRAGAESMSALAVLLCNRLINVSVIALTGVAFAAVDPALVGDRILVPFLSVVSLAAIALLVVAFSPGLSRRVGRCSDRRAGPTRWGRLAARIGELSKTAAILGSLDTAARVRILGVCLVRQLIGVTAIFSFAAALPLDLSWVSSGLARAVAMLATLIPVSFAGIGMREGGLIVVLNALGVAAAPAVALSVLLLVRDVLTRLVGGVIEAWRFPWWPLLRNGTSSSRRTDPGAP